MTICYCRDWWRCLRCDLDCRDKDCSGRVGSHYSPTLSTSGQRKRKQSWRFQPQQNNNPQIQNSHITLSYACPVLFCLLSIFVLLNLCCLLLRTVWKQKKKKIGWIKKCSSNRKPSFLIGMDFTTICFLSTTGLGSWSSWHMTYSVPIVYNLRH